MLPDGSLILKQSRLYNQARPWHKQAAVDHPSTPAASLFDVLVVDDQEDGHQQQQDDADHDELVGSDAPRHAGQHPPGSAQHYIWSLGR